jgi:hypothetical protein
MKASTAAMRSATEVKLPRRMAFPQPDGPFSQVVAGVGFEPT